MNKRRIPLNVLLLLAVLLVVEPRLFSIKGSPYELFAPHLWLAALYFVGITWVALLLVMRFLRVARDASHLARLVFFLVLGFAFAALLPFGGIMASFYWLGGSAGVSHWLLFNKYLSHIFASVFEGGLWALSLCLVFVAINLVRKQQRAIGTRSEPVA